MAHSVFFEKMCHYFTSNTNGFIKITKKINIFRGGTLTTEYRNGVRISGI